MFRRLTLLAALGALASGAAAAVAPPAEAAASRAPAGVADDVRAIERGIRSARAAGRLPRKKAARYLRATADARAAVRRLPASRAAPLARVLRIVRLQAGAYNRPRALALFAMLEHNTAYLSKRGLPADETDTVGPDGIVYRAGWGYGLQFHPLANVVALNLHLYAGRKQKAMRLARALSHRAVPRRRGSVWEYYFPYAGGAPPWTSGMAQAVGAQAFARAGRRLTAEDLFPTAHRAYRTIPGRLVRPGAHGPWIRLYSFSDLAVLNAQLQAALSLADYGRILNVPEAMGLGDRLEDSARIGFDEFDTGAWSNYSPRREATLKYHNYHVDLAKWVARRSRGNFWPAAHARFVRYTREPPSFQAGEPGRAIYPWPADGFRDSTKVKVWVSKISTVSVRLGGDWRSLGVRRRGWHTVVWRPGRRQPGVYRPAVTAVDLAGNRGTGRLAPVRIAVDRKPPRVDARVRRATLVWRGSDNASPWLRLRVKIERRGVRKTIALGRRPMAGSVRLSLPRGRWKAVLIAKDTTGNPTRVDLGPIPNGS